jgi:hypothetical protein
VRNLDALGTGCDVGPGPGVGRPGGGPATGRRRVGPRGGRGLRHRQGRSHTLAPGPCGLPLSGPLAGRSTAILSGPAVFFRPTVFSPAGTVSPAGIVSPDIIVSPDGIYSADIVVSPDGLVRLAGGRGPAPDFSYDDDVVLLRQRRHATPGRRFSQVADLRDDQFGEAFALQDGAGGQPGDHTWWQHVQPEQCVVEGEPEHGEQDHIRHGDSREYGDLANRHRHWQPEVVQLVEPLLDPPNTGIRGQIHLVLSFRSGRRFSGRRGRSRCPGRATERCSGCRRSQRSPLRGR